MRIKKFKSFNESSEEELMHENPSQYVSTALKQLQNKIDRIFNYDPSKTGEGGEQLKSPEKKDDSGDITFKDLSIDFEGSEISKFSKLNDSLTVTFTDIYAMYKLIIIINIKNAIPEDKEKDFSYKDIKKCYIKLKKYDINTYEIIGEVSKNATISKIDEDFLVKLKLELDEDFAGEDEFEIET
jgi:hypothetical protein